MDARHIIWLPFKTNYTVHTITILTIENSQPECLPKYPHKERQIKPPNYLQITFSYNITITHF